MTLMVQFGTALTTDKRQNMFWNAAWLDCILLIDSTEHLKCWNLMCTMNSHVTWKDMMINDALLNLSWIDKCQIDQHNEQFSSLHNTPNISSGLHNVSVSSSLHKAHFVSSWFHNISKVSSGLHKVSFVFSGFHDTFNVSSGLHNISNVSSGLHMMNLRPPPLLSSSIVIFLWGQW